MANALVQKITATQAGWAPLALRIPVGIIFAAHGGQKLFGWFGGHGLEGTGQWMASIGLEPGYLMAGNGLFMSNNGYEFALALLAATVSLALSGAGQASVDAVLAER